MNKLNDDASMEFAIYRSPNLETCLNIAKHKNGEVLERVQIDEYVLSKVYYDYFKSGIWECNCSEFKRPKPCTPNFCRHTDVVNPFK